MSFASGGIAPNPVLAQPAAWAPATRPAAVPAAAGLDLTVLPAHSDRAMSRADPAEEGGALSREEILEKRRRHLGPNVALFFDDPLHIVAGRGCELFDPEGHSYLDCINNVSHVGHSHPKVAAAVSRQLYTLNTNCRYLHSALVNYAEVLQATMPDPLEVVYMVCSGSEANDLAWRMAVENARQQGVSAPLHVVVMDHAYHGHTSFCTDASPYKHNGPGGSGTPTYVHVLPCPDVYRGKNLDGATAARKAIAAARAQGGRVAAFFCESIISCGGQVILPAGYLESVYREMRAEGALCVADEVQCGFGRVGRAFWAFELQDVVPDIVTCGKPIGNGFPMSAVVTSRQVAARFSNGMEFFATYGGSTAAATAGLAVMEVIREEGLQENALLVGSYLRRRLRELQEQYPDIIGDVRGEGLMIGVEIVTDASSKAQAPVLAKHLKERCRAAHRVLLSTEGPYGNIIKIKPPICFGVAEADRMLAALEAVIEQEIEGVPGLKHELLAASRLEVAAAREMAAAREQQAGHQLARL
ncbi:hypothetical protein N2152v2_004714 [Parachlorella kessleri]